MHERREYLAQSTRNAAVPEAKSYSCLVDTWETRTPTLWYPIEIVRNLTKNLKLRIPLKIQRTGHTDGNQRLTIRPRCLPLDHCMVFRSSEWFFFRGPKLWLDYIVARVRSQVSAHAVRLIMDLTQQNLKKTAQAFGIGPIGALRSRKLDYVRGQERRREPSGVGGHPRSRCRSRDESIQPCVKAICNTLGRRGSLFCFLHAVRKKGI